MVLILFFISAVLATFPVAPLKTTAILPEPHQNIRLANELPNMKISSDEKLARLNSLSALPDDIQVKIILDTQNPQNAIQWLKMNKGSADKLISNSKFKHLLPDVLKFSIMNKYYDADIVKQILNEPNLVNWNPNGAQNNIKHAMSAEKFAKIIQNVDLSSAAGRQIKEFTLLSISKSIDENPGNTFKLISLDSSDILAKLILSDATLTTKFTNDLSLIESTVLRNSFRTAIQYESLNSLKLMTKSESIFGKLTDEDIAWGFQTTNADLFRHIVQTKEFTSRITLLDFETTLRMIILRKFNNHFKILLGESHFASMMNIDWIFEKSIAFNNHIILRTLGDAPEYLTKVSDRVIDDGFVHAAWSNYPMIIKTFNQNEKLAKRLSRPAFETTITNAVRSNHRAMLTTLLDSDNIWKDMQLSIYLKRVYLTADDKSKQIFHKNELLMNKISEIQN